MATAAAANAKNLELEGPASVASTSIAGATTRLIAEIDDAKTQQVLTKIYDWSTKEGAALAPPHQIVDVTDHSLAIQMLRDWTLENAKHATEAQDGIDQHAWEETNKEVWGSKSLGQPDLFVYQLRGVWGSAGLDCDATIAYLFANYTKAGATSFAIPKMAIKDEARFLAFVAAHTSSATAECMKKEDLAKTMFTTSFQLANYAKPTLALVDKATPYAGLHCTSVSFHLDRQPRPDESTTVTTFYDRMYSFGVTINGDADKYEQV